MKRILLDGGTHFGKGLRKMHAIYGLNTFDQIFTWEANPFTYDRFLKNPRFFNLPIQSFNSALSNKDGTILLNIETVFDKETNGPSKTGLGTSVISLNDWKAKGRFLDQEIVPCINFAQWILDNCHKDDFIVIKLDIEGSEYDVLEEMVRNNAINYINELNIEWHSHMFSDPKKYQEREIYLLKIMNEKNIPVKPC